MLESIDPVALPLWAVLLFAASMYPLGLMLPGCVCCGGGNCTTCGNASSGYGASQNAYGMMCCAGTIAASITVRLTHVGASTSSLETRSSTGASYTKTTASFSCSSADGDYVIPLRKIGFPSSGYECTWFSQVYDSCATTRYMHLVPSSDCSGTTPVGGTFPNYAFVFNWLEFTLSGSLRTQACTFDADLGSESCTVGTTITSSTWNVSLGKPCVEMSAQRCNPAGLVFLTSGVLWASTRCEYPFEIRDSFDTGCRFRLELV